MWFLHSTKFYKWRKCVLYCIKSCGSSKILNSCTFLFSCIPAHWLDWPIRLALPLHLCQGLTTFLRQILEMSSEQQTKHHRNGKKDRQIIQALSNRISGNMHRNKQTTGIMRKTLLSTLIQQENADKNYSSERPSLGIHMKTNAGMDVRIKSTLLHC